MLVALTPVSDVLVIGTALALWFVLYAHARWHELREPQLARAPR